MGGCVVPPGTAAMCQTGGEEERGSEQERERATEGGRGWKEREGEREGCKGTREMEEEKREEKGQRHRLVVLQLSVKITNRTH